MARPSSFSSFDDATIVRMRAEGAGWKSIGATLHRGHNTTRDHAYRVGLAIRVPTGRMASGAAALAQARAAREAQPHQLDSHAPMAAFHAVSWGAIWAGHSWRP